MSQHPTIFRTLLLLLLDTVLTASIALASIVLCLFIGSAILAEEYGLRGFTLFSLFHEQVTYTNLFGRDSVFPVFFVASFFTSIWVWLYVLSSVTIRILHKFRAAWMKLLPALSVEDKPMQVVGRVAGVIAGCGYLILLGGIWIFRHL